MRNPLIDAALEKSLSRERLHKYLTTSGGDLDQAILLYEKNMKLSEAFYTPLQCLEICLRNKLDRELSLSFGPDWYQNGGPGFNHVAVQMIQKALDELRNSKSPVSPGAVIAELSFGFWVSILAPRYDATLWRSSLTKAFRQNGRPMKRDGVHRRMNALRRFRNRVAHHEPIFQRDLQMTHDEILEAIGWLCMHTAAWTESHSRVPVVLSSI